MFLSLTVVTACNRDGRTGPADPATARPNVCCMEPEKPADAISDRGGDSYRKVGGLIAQMHAAEGSA